jgi:glycerol-3-phosphate dehydrogenase
MLAVSSGVHLTLDRSFLPGEHALMIPETSDGRVLFAVPWQGRVILGTTDEPRPAPELEPRPLEREVQFLLEHASEYLSKPPTAADVLSIFTGLRPLVRQDNAGATKSLSRDHVIAVSPGGLVTITGGKWTSYRRMAEDTVDQVARAAGLAPHPSCTGSLALHGASPGTPPRFAQYGSDAVELERLVERDPALGRKLHPRLEVTAVEVVWAARHEMARTVEDVLARRNRALQLDARAAMEAAPEVARILAIELDRDDPWITHQTEDFAATAKYYLPAGTLVPEPLGH